MFGLRGQHSFRGMFMPGSVTCPDLPTFWESRSFYRQSSARRIPVQKLLKQLLLPLQSLRILSQLFLSQ